MSGRSKCTAGGDEESTKRSGETGSHASHKHIADIQSHTFALTHTFRIVSLYDPLPARITPRKLNAIQLNTL